MKDADIFYNFENDLNKYPDAWLYVIFGGRGTGKTYSGLKSAKNKHITFAYCKRTKEDVKIVCAGNSANSKKTVDFDLSPFKALNRDMNWNVRAFSVIDGLGGFYDCTEDNEPVGSPLGYIAALSMVTKYKGMDFTDVDWLIFDEFVPKIYERMMRSEGEALLDFYKTVARSREALGRPALKLICFANADNAASPLTNTLEITDTIVSMSLKKEAEFYDEKRGIYIHRLQDNKSFREKEKESMIYRAMAGTKWLEKSLENEFENDFSNVRRINLKGFSPLAIVFYNRKPIYIYQDSNGVYALTSKKFTKKDVLCYDLQKDNDKKAFWYDLGFSIKDACITNNAQFEVYSYYDLIINYLKTFKL